MNPILFVGLFVGPLLPHVMCLANRTDVIRAGFIFPRTSNIASVKEMLFATTAGAVAIALERVESERILPGINWT